MSLKVTKGHYNSSDFIKTDDLRFYGHHCPWFEKHFDGYLYYIEAI